MQSAAVQTVYLKDYRPPLFLIDTVALTFELQPERTLVHSQLSISRHASTEQSEPLRLDGVQLQLDAIALDGQALAPDAYAVDATGLTIFHVPDQCTLAISVQIQPHQNKTLMGLYQSGGNYCTQCEAQGFRRITYFIDRPDIMAYFTTTIIADPEQYPYMLSNGNRVSSKALDDGRLAVTWHDPSLKPCYLFALVAGQFDLMQKTFTTQSGRTVALELYLEPGCLSQGDFALQSLVNAMTFDEQYFGREYDLDLYMIVAVSDFNMGAMENKGLNIFNTKYVLAQPHTATDQDYTAIEAVIGHEYFHNWTGNRITCRDWFQLTLKEGLTVYRDQLFTEVQTNSSAARVRVANVVRQLQFKEDASPMAHPIRPHSYVEINNFYTHTVYRKGAEVIRMIETFIGKSRFRQGMDLYFERHDGQAVTTDDFVAAMADASGFDFSQFKRWYDQAGTPTLSIDTEYQPHAQRFILTVEQSGVKMNDMPEPLPYALPLEVALFSVDGVPFDISTVGAPGAVTHARVLTVSQQKQQFIFDHISSPPVPSILRGFSAPVIVDYDYTEAMLLTLIRHDTDAFCRYDAMQLYFKRLIHAIAVAPEQNPPDFTPAFLRTMDQFLKDPTDGDTWSLMLTMPCLESLLQFDSRISIEHYHQARSTLESMLAGAFLPLWSEIFQSYQATPYCYEPSAVHHRARKNRALYYWVQSQSPEAYHAAVNQYAQADNMTDTLAVLHAFNNLDCPERKDVLDAFYERWNSQPLLVNKWLAMQASSCLPDTVDVVESLLEHPAFDFLNPNNVYALLGGFANNALAFHQPCGRSYRLLADCVLKIDSHNPQVAARILLPMTQFQRYSPDLQSLMVVELKRIAANEQLSTDVYELVTKAVASA